MRAISMGMMWLGYLLLHRCYSNGLCIPARDAGGRQSHDKGTALTNHTLDGYLSTMELGNTLCNGQPEPTASLHATASPIDPIKSVEHTRQMFRSNARAGVAYA